MVDNILAIENQQVIRNYVIDVEMGAYLHKLKQIKLKTARSRRVGIMKWNLKGRKQKLEKSLER